MNTLFHRANNLKDALPVAMLSVMLPCMSSKVGRPPLTAEQRDASKARRNLQLKAWREANLERAREIGRDCEKRRRDARAVIEGRIPGKTGPMPKYTEEERRMRRNEKQKAYYAANLEKERERARVREQAKRDGTFVSKARARLTAAEQRLVGVVNTHKRRARVRGNGGTHTRDDILRLLDEQRGHCAKCGEAFGPDGYHVDHKIPIVRGGSNGPENLQLLDPPCNLKKGAQHLEGDVS